MRGVFVTVAMLLAACAVVSAALDRVPTWLKRVRPLRTHSAQAFQFRQLVDSRREQLEIHVSFAPPARRCAIVFDRADGLPLLIAVDGRVWVYDPIGGQILVIRAEPYFVNRPINGIQNHWGIRADFPDEASRRTIDIDPAGVLEALSWDRPEHLSLAAGKQRIATFKGQDVFASLEADDHDPPRPKAYTFTGNANGPVSVRINSFVYDAPLPAWHRDLDPELLRKHLPVGIVAESNTWPPEAQGRLRAFLSLLRHGSLFVLRPAMRDPTLRESIPIQIDYDQVRRNDHRMSALWRTALAEQRFELPPVTAATQPTTLP